MVYAPGRPNSNGPALKFKFRETSTAICLGDSGEGKRSIMLGMLSEQGLVVSVGKVTIPLTNLSLSVTTSLKYFTCTNMNKAPSSSLF